MFYCVEDCAFVGNHGLYLNLGVERYVSDCAVIHGISNDQYKSGIALLKREDNLLFAIVFGMIVLTS